MIVFFYKFFQIIIVFFYREGNSGLRKQSNGPVITKSTNQVPNFYKTAVEHFSNHNSDFFSTYNVDREKFAEITRNKNIYVSTDNLSSSIDDLLESCRQGSDKHPNNGNSAIREDTNEWLSSSSTEIANGRTSPIPEMDGLRYDLQRLLAHLSLGVKLNRFYSVRT